MCFTEIKALPGEISFPNPKSNRGSYIERITHGKSLAAETYQSQSPILSININYFVQHRANVQIFLL